MEMQTEEEVELKRYLLGELGEEERWIVEERLFLDGEYLLQLQALEDELIDAYVYGDLPPSEQEKVKAELLSRPGRHADLRFAQALKNFNADLDSAVLPAAVSPHLAPPPPAKTLLPFLPSFAGRNRLVVFSLAAAILIICALAIWQVSEAVRRRDNPPMAQAPAAPQSEQHAPAVRESPPGSDQAQANTGEGAEGQPGQRPRPPQRPDEADVQRVAERPGQQPRQRPRTSPPIERKPSLAITVVLLPVAFVRGGGAGNVVTISSDVGTINLQLPLYIESQADSRYDAMLQTGGKTIRTWLNLKPAEDGRHLQVSVPVKFLSRSNYQIKLAVITASRRSKDFVTYTFQVQKK